MMTTTVAVMIRALPLSFFGGALSDEGTPDCCGGMDVGGVTGVDGRTCAVEEMGFEGATNPVGCIFSVGRGGSGHFCVGAVCAVCSERGGCGAVGDSCGAADEEELDIFSNAWMNSSAVA